ncbi:hypothetical protein [Enterococcus caccae]|uniref:Uncharacterized protein n=1 Tax=Enterococcus caccae ATCC BAA-1240 TaxID=1158612 RepID=R3TXL8_9ENTE|nr:hypothetical protein [Enterococcus caccae]EOL46359.1 hypothetical protein UC7_01326 [Enterococcus caccae ATCC BAA-1240]EOT60728.1 hypothetical protein I580_01628 [Enterococcus caccae ATCC BAA-1240]OJG27462.1 hypothetical protein RU98_GL002551 [Enterococcus caccae]
MDFAESTLPEKNLSVNSITPIKNIEEEITGYDVGFECQNKEHGYVIIDLRLEGDYIAEFNLGEGVLDFYTQMLKRSNTVDSIPENEQVIVETIPTEYNVVLEEEVINSNGKDMTVEEFSEYEEEIADTAEKLVEENENYSTTATYEHTGHVLRNYP